jgi:ATP-dependent Clp protease ATP-binding subunit ClpA
MERTQKEENDEIYISRSKETIDNYIKSNNYRSAFGLLLFVLNRLDDVILFKPLGEDVIKTIIGIELMKLVVRLKEKKYKITIDKSVSNRIYELNSQEEYGARPIKRIIQNLCEDFLSEEILKGNIVEDQSLTLKYKDKLILSKK